jgi:hypothetical protein
MGCRLKLRKWGNWLLTDFDVLNISLTSLQSRDRGGHTPVSVC